MKPGPLSFHSPLCKRGRASRSDDGGFAFDVARAKQSQAQIPRSPLFQRGQKRRRKAEIQALRWKARIADRQPKQGRACFYSPLCKRGRASRSDDGGFALDFVRAKQGQAQIPRSPLFQRGQKRRRKAEIQVLRWKARIADRQPKQGCACFYSPLCKRGRASRSDDGGFAFDVVQAKQSQEKIARSPLFQRGQKRRRKAEIQALRWKARIADRQPKQCLACFYSPLCKRGRASRSDDGGFALDVVRAKQDQEQIPRGPLFQRGQKRRQSDVFPQRQPKPAYQERQAGRSA